MTPWCASAGFGLADSGRDELAFNVLLERLSTAVGLPYIAKAVGWPCMVGFGWQVFMGLPASRFALPPRMANGYAHCQLFVEAQTLTGASHNETNKRCLHGAISAAMILFCRKPSACFASEASFFRSELLIEWIFPSDMNWHPVCYSGRHARLVVCL